MSFGLGDGIVVARTGYGLYAQVYMIAKKAPEDFKDLLEELKLVKYCIVSIAAALVGTEASAAKEIVRRSVETLDRFRPLEAKYKGLESSDKGLWLARLKYVTDQPEIRECRLELQKIFQRLPTIALIGELARGQALGLPQLTTGTHTASLDPLPTPSDPAKSESSESGGVRHIEFAASSQSSLPNSTRSDGNVSSTGSDTTNSSREIPCDSCKASRKTPLEYAGPIKHGSRLSESESKLPQSSFIRAHSWLSSFAAQPKSGDGRDDLFIVDLASVQKLMERPLNLNSELEKWCKEEVQRLGESDGVDMLSWLIIALWWLIKSRTMRHLRSGEVGEHQISGLQTAVDLLKSSYIVRNIILTRVAGKAPLNHTQWKIIQDLATAVDIELKENTEISSLQSLEHVATDAKSFTEPFVQYVEYFRALPCALDSIEGPRRWLAVDMEHCGNDDEIVLFRTFVNAQLGDRQVCRKSVTAPYILLLSSRPGSADLVLSLLNQHGTVHLSRSIDPDDIKFHDGKTGAVTSVFEFDFPSQHAKIQFLSHSDLEAFLDIPRKHFAATTNREPKECEVLVSRHGLNAYVSGQSKETGSFITEILTNGGASHACEISLFEVVPLVSWQATRRIVISSTPGIQQKPWCVDFFVPLSMVQVRQNGNDLRLIWSDFTFLDKQSDGNFLTKWSFVYDGEKHADFELHVVFATQAEAASFAQSVLRPFETPFEAPEVERQNPHFETTSTSQTLEVYRIRNRNEPEKKGYSSLCLTDALPNTNQMTEVYYVYRDLDFSVRTGTDHTIDFTDLFVPHYKSNLTDLNAEPAADGLVPVFSSSGVRRRKDAHFTFESLVEMSRLFKLLLGWDLELVRSVKTVKIGSTVRFFPKTPTDVIVTLWSKSKGNDRDVRLALRSDHPIDLRWTTAALENSSYCRRTARDVVFKKVNLTQGHSVDGESLMASNPNSLERPHDRQANLTISFDTVDEAKDFYSTFCQLTEDRTLQAPSKLNVLRPNILSSLHFPQRP